MKAPRIPKQILGLAFIFAIVIAALFVARMLFIPPSFGKYGHYRADAVNEIVAQEINYAGYQACMECHDEIYKPKERSYHKSVSCEACHGPAAKHVEAPDEFVPGAPRERGYCPLCHDYNPSRPTGFPQIITELHNPGKACMTCHNPHNPVLPHTPEECSACHREIANVKRISYHASLPCVRCHTVPEKHMVQPKFVLAQVPVEREFCGECHAEGAPGGTDIPRIDLDTHGERYLCWDCHYPHYPEAR